MKKRHQPFGVRAPARRVHFDNSPKAQLQREISLLSSKKEQIYTGVFDEEEIKLSE